ncbi:MAG TPA: FMN-binding protein [Oryzihumus sp.]|nr:FMN-binding protein [Oryzihumus sp.]
MRRIITALLSTITILVLLFSYRTSTNSGSSVAAALRPANQPAVTGNNPTPAPAPSPTTTSGGLGGGDDGGGSDDGGAAAPLPAPKATTTTPPSTGSGSSTSGTFTGDPADTRWGTVQIQISVSNGKITQVTPVQYPQDNPRDAEINSYALPVLGQEAISAQSAQIDMVSGATVTSGGYIQSLQSAIDKAHL